MPTGSTPSSKTPVEPFTRRCWVAPAWPPGMYFRLLLVGYFEGIDSERGIAWRAADSLAIRQFLPRVG
jgi:transposase